MGQAISWKSDRNIGPKNVLFVKQANDGSVIQFSDFPNDHVHISCSSHEGVTFFDMINSNWGFGMKKEGKHHI